MTCEREARSCKQCGCTSTRLRQEWTFSLHERTSGIQKRLPTHQEFLKISTKSVPMQVREPPESPKMKFHMRLGAISSLTSPLAPLLNPFGSHLAPQEPPKTSQKASQEGSQSPPNEVPEATWSDFGAKTSFGTLFGLPSAPQGAPKTSQRRQKLNQKEPKRASNETESLSKSI